MTFQQQLEQIQLSIANYSLREAKAKAEAAEYRAENERVLLEWTRAEKKKIFGIGSLA